MMFLNVLEKRVILKFLREDERALESFDLDSSASIPIKSGDSRDSPTRNWLLSAV